MGSTVASGDVTQRQVRRREPLAVARQAASKVPQITVFFWIIKILTTAQGEATSDWLVYRIDPFTAVAIAGVALAAALVLQFRARKYVAWIYWLTVDLVAIFGTMAADVLHVGLGVPYLVSTTAFAVLLALVFLAERRDRSVHQAYYWLAIVVVRTAATNLADFGASDLRLG